ncbi:MAG: hypothetical protein JSW68_10530 [Burkholderiales bacterium]|nr:MAG: hypothetical protein JSW68_10530 [Burkholderiales bacterium]
MGETANRTGEGAVGEGDRAGGRNGDNDSVEARLAQVKAKRGFLLPHHGLLAVLSERLLETYDAAYTALALEHKVLSVRDRETVWLGVLIATDEALATHHIPKYLSDGGDVGEFAAICRLAAAAIGAHAYEFVADHWLPHLPGFDAERAYRGAIEAAFAPLAPRIAWPTVCAIHAARADFRLLRWSLLAAYEAGVPEPELAEAVSIMMFPGSVPRFVEAAGVWLGLIREGRVRPSPAFAAWARVEGQGGYDEASQARG